MHNIGLLFLLYGLNPYGTSKKESSRVHLFIFVVRELSRNTSLMTDRYVYTLLAILSYLDVCAKAITRHMNKTGNLTKRFCLKL